MQSERFYFAIYCYAGIHKIPLYIQALPPVPVALPNAWPDACLGRRITIEITHVNAMNDQKLVQRIRVKPSL